MGVKHSISSQQKVHKYHHDKHWEWEYILITRKSDYKGKGLKLRKEEGCKQTNEGKRHKNSLFGLSVSTFTELCVWNSGEDVRKWVFTWKEWRNVCNVMSISICTAFTTIPKNDLGTFCRRLVCVSKQVFLLLGIATMQYFFSLKFILLRFFR